MFVGLGIDRHLRHHGSSRDGVGGDEVLAGQRAVATAAQGLAVEGEDRPFLVRQAEGDPAGQRRLKGHDIEAAEQEGVGGFGGRLTATEAEHLGEGEPLVAAKLGNGLIGLAASEHSENGQAEDGGEGVADATAVAGVGNVGENFE